MFFLVFGSKKNYLEIQSETDKYEALFWEGGWGGPLITTTTTTILTTITQLKLQQPKIQLLPQLKQQQPL